MKINKLIFFNHYRNGDCFINRQYVRDIIDQLKIDQVYYAHDNHPSITKDLPVIHKPTQSLNSQVHQGVKIGYDPGENALYINTWVGVTVPRYFNWGQHANFVILNDIWQEYYQDLNLVFKGDHGHYLPEFDFEHFDLTLCNQWLDQIDRKPFTLICNGKQQSEQSDLGNMQNVLPSLVDMYPDHVFLVCDKLNFQHPNVFYTDNIFQSTVGNLPYIAYLSQFANLVVGKNSGPFSFSHLSTNLNDHTKTLLCFSKDFKSCLTGQGIYYARTLFSDQIDDHVVIETISQTINTLNDTRLNRPTGMQRIQ